MSKAAINSNGKAKLDHMTTVMVDTNSSHRLGDTDGDAGAVAVAVSKIDQPEEAQHYSSLVGTSSGSDSAELSSRKRQRLTMSGDTSQGPSASMQPTAGSTTSTITKRSIASYPLALPTAASRNAASVIWNTGTGQAQTGEKHGFQGDTQAVASGTVYPSSTKDLPGQEKKVNEFSSTSMLNYTANFPTSNRGRRGGRKSIISSAPASSHDHYRPPGPQGKSAETPAETRTKETTTARAGSNANSMVVNPTLDDHTAAALLTSLYEVPVRPRADFVTTALVSVDEPSAPPPFQQSAGSAPSSTYTDVDVLLGKGGLSNNHPGNKAYVAKALSMQDRYKPASTSEKTQMSKELVKFVHDRKGRFMLKQPGTVDQWVEVDFTTARKKASRLLRGDSRRNPEDGTFSLGRRKSSCHSIKIIDNKSTTPQPNNSQISSKNETGDNTNVNNKSQINNTNNTSSGLGGDSSTAPRGHAYSQAPHDVADAQNDLSQGSAKNGNDAKNLLSGSGKPEHNSGESNV